MSSENQSLTFAERQQRVITWAVIVFVFALASTLTYVIGAATKNGWRAEAACATRGGSWSYVAGRVGCYRITVQPVDSVQRQVP